MATAAELKARLAKYATQQPTQSSVRPQAPTGSVSSRPAGQGGIQTANTTAAVETPVVGERKDNEQVVVQESASVAQQSRTEVNDTSETPTHAAATTQDDSVRTEGVPATAAPVEQKITVRTDVQSTDVVIVERPASDAADSRELGTMPPVGSTDLDTTNPVHQGFLQRLADLETALLERDPLMKTHLGAIHKAMIEYEEIANLLRPEEIAKIMAAQQQHTGIVLRAETLGKSKAATNKKAAQLGLGDL